MTSSDHIYSESIRSSIQNGIVWVDRFGRGEVRLSAAHLSSTIATLIIIFTIINSIKSKWNKDVKKSSVQRDRTRLKSSKKGKKGRGRNSHSFSKGNYVPNHNDKVDDEDSMSLRRSPSPLRNRCLSDMESTTTSGCSESYALVIESSNTFPSSSVPIQGDNITSCESKSCRSRYDNSLVMSTLTSSSDDRNQKKSLSKTENIENIDQEKKKKKMNKIGKKVDTSSFSNPGIVTKSMSLPDESNNTGHFLKNGEPRELKEDIPVKRIERNNRRVKILLEDKITTPPRGRNDFNDERLMTSTSLETRLVKDDRNVTSAFRPVNDESNISSSIFRVTFAKKKRAPFSHHAGLGSSATIHQAHLKHDVKTDQLDSSRYDMNWNPTHYSSNTFTMHDHENLGIVDTNRIAVHHSAVNHNLYEEPKVSVVRAPPGINTSSHELQSGKIPLMVQSDHSHSLFSSQIVRVPHYDCSVGSASANSLANDMKFSEPPDYSDGEPSYDLISKQVVLPPLSPLIPPLSFPRNSEWYKRRYREEDAEAEMEVLGCRMAGSILDF